MSDFSIKKCLDGRVEAGALSREGAEQALRMITGLEQKYAGGMSRDAATSAAIAEAARIMKDEAIRQKGITAKQILASARVVDDVMSHPDGVAAGGMAVLTRDMRGKAKYDNVETKKEVVLGQMMRRFEAGLNAYRSKAAGLVQDTVGIRNLIKELFGESTNDGTAKSAAKGWRDATEYGADRFIAGGGDLTKKDDWRVPQISDAKRMKQEGRDAWVGHMTDAVRRGALQVLDYETGQPMTGLKLADLLHQAFDNITSELPPPPGKGGSYGRHNERRVFQWQNADGWLAYNDRFGAGSGGIFDVLTGHLEGMARDIALTEVLGPKHGATLRAIVEMATKAESDLGTLAHLNPMRAVESAGAIGRAYDLLSGRLGAWTQALKTSFQMELMGFIADNVGKAKGDVSKPLRRLLDRYGISAAEWDTIRAAPLVEHEGAKFFDPANVSDRKLGEKLMGAIIEERAFAVLEPDARVRQITTAGLKRGTIMGEVARSAMLFKSFSITMATTHLARTFIDASGSKVAGFAALSTLLAVAGAFSIQARQVASGKDPRRMDDPKFWGAAAMQGGGAGIFGDFFAAGLDRNQQGLSVTLAGPVFGLVDQAARLAVPNYRAMLDGKPSHYGAEVARAIRHNLPGANLWYARLVVDRAVMDNIQALLDPEYRQSFARMEERARKDYGQRFWWRPGQGTPERPPDLGAMGPR